MATKRAFCSVCSQPMYTSDQVKCVPTCRECRKKRDKPVCTELSCLRPQWARTLCSVHYCHWHREQRRYTIVCEACGKTARVERKRSTHCSYDCGMNSVNAAKAGMSVKEWLNRPDDERGRQRKLESPTLKQCNWCLQLHDAKSKYCSELCEERFKQDKESRKVQMDKLRVFRQSFESGDFATFLSELRRRSVVEDDGCWYWPKLRNGYPVVDWSGKRHQVHRLALQAKHGKPLGTQSAHHKCANTACVNPDHLQPVTHRDNVAEMLQRQSYLNRILELEQALNEVDPHHPVLDRIEIA